MAMLRLPCFRSQEEADSADSDSADSDSADSEAESAPSPTIAETPIGTLVTTEGGLASSLSLSLPRGLTENG